MSLSVTAQAKKGAATRTLSRLVRDTIARGDVPAGVAKILRSCAAAANRMIPIAPVGAQLTIQLLVTDDPLGGWTGSATVNVDRLEAVRAAARKN